MYYYISLNDDDYILSKYAVNEDRNDIKITKEQHDTIPNNLYYHDKWLRYKRVDGEVIDTKNELDIEHKTEIEKEAALSDLMKTDQPYIRVLEDLIDTLINKDVITLNDLPAISKSKHNERKALRGKL